MVRVTEFELGCGVWGVGRGIGGFVLPMSVCMYREWMLLGRFAVASVG